jgi:glycerophosphoryl diester phosphodiesterase
MQAPIVIAHRGDSSRSLENSLEALRLARSIPADMIEIDIRRSLDNALYVMHDKHTGRTADRNIDIEQSRSDQVSRVKLKNGEPVPTLEDALNVVGGITGLNLEIKSKGAGRLTAEYLRDFGYCGSVLISSFLESEIIAARSVSPSIETSGIFDSFTVKNLASYRAKGYNMISLRRQTVNRDLITVCHDQGVKVYVWTIDDEHEMKKFIDWEVDGIYTNKPSILKGLLHGLQR